MYSVVYNVSRKYTFIWICSDLSCFKFSCNLSTLRSSISILASDIFPHLLSILLGMGITGSALSCFQSYLTWHSGSAFSSSPALHWGPPRINTRAPALRHIQDFTGANHPLTRWTTHSCSCRFQPDEPPVLDLSFGQDRHPQLNLAQSKVLVFLAKQHPPPPLQNLKINKRLAFQCLQY